MVSYFRSFGSVFLFFASGLISSNSAAAQYVPPPGFIQTVATAPIKTAEFSCPPTPEPFTGALRFRSKYEGSDAARATLNRDAERAYRDATKNVTATQRLVSKLVARYARTGDRRVAQCAIQVLNAWADAGALTSTQTNHTGKAVRKWALASFSSSWLQLKFAQTRPLNDDPQRAAQVERWLSQLGTLTLSDWEGLPLSRVNNHSYWAAWALIATAVVTGRDDLFTRSLTVFHTALRQVDARGFLPNELKRRQRALAYHNYALQPLVMIALFARANDAELSPTENAALRRLVQRVLGGLDDPAAFAAATGVKQDVSFMQNPGNLTWIKSCHTLSFCAPQQGTKQDAGE